MDEHLIDTIQEPIMGLLGLALSFIALYIIYKAIQLKNRERLALIEKGMDPSLSDSKPSNRQNNLKNGLLLIGTALGVFAGYILNLTLGIPNFIAYTTMIFVICGFVLIFFHKSNKG